MWQEFTPDGALRYPNFLETVVRIAADVLRCASAAARSS